VFLEDEWLKSQNNQNDFKFLEDVSKDMIIISIVKFQKLTHI